MGIYLNPDNKDFQRALNSKIYIDKSELVSYTNSIMNTEQQFVCSSRPRRFGKSMAANMLTAYYSRGCDSGELFQNLKIAKSESCWQPFSDSPDPSSPLQSNIQSHILTQTEDYYFQTHNS